MNKILNTINDALNPPAKKGTNTVIVNGKKFSVQGNNISVIGRTVEVDGKVVIKLDNECSEVQVKFEGDLASLDCTEVQVSGNIKGDVDCTNLVCGDIGGSVDAANVKCKNINGDVDATNVKGL